MDRISIDLKPLFDFIEGHLALTMFTALFSIMLLLCFWMLSRSAKIYSESRVMSCEKERKSKQDVGEGKMAIAVISGIIALISLVLVAVQAAK